MVGGWAGMWGVECLVQLKGAGESMEVCLALTPVERVKGHAMMWGILFA